MNSGFWFGMVLTLSVAITWLIVEIAPWITGKLRTRKWALPKQKVCDSCGTELPTIARFCRRCGKHPNKAAREEVEALRRSWLVPPECKLVPINFEQHMEAIAIQRERFATVPPIGSPHPGMDGQKFYCKESQYDARTGELIAVYHSLKA